MKLSIEIPDELAKSGWISDMAYEGSEACFCSDNADGLGPASILVYALAHILNENMPVEEQQAYLDDAMQETDG